MMASAIFIHWSMNCYGLSSAAPDSKKGKSDQPATEHWHVVVVQVLHSGAQVLGCVP